MSHRTDRFRKKIVPKSPERLITRVRQRKPHRLQYMGTATLRAAHCAQARQLHGPSSHSLHVPQALRTFLHRHSSPQRFLVRDSHFERALEKHVASSHRLRPHSRPPACASIALMCGGRCGKPAEHVAHINLDFPVIREREVGWLEDTRHGAGSNPHNAQLPSVERLSSLGRKT